MMMKAEKAKKTALKSFMKKTYKKIEESAEEGLLNTFIIVPKDMDLFFEEQMDKGGFLWRRKFFYSDNIKYQIIWSHV